MATPPPFEQWAAQQSAPGETPGPIYVKTPGGDTVQLRDPSELATAQAQGYTLASSDDVDKFKLQEKYGNTEGQIRAGAAGYLRGISFGLSDIALRALGTPAEELRGLQEANPGISTLGEVGGVLGGGALVRGVGAMGRGVTAATEAALPTAESLVGRIAKHAISQGAGLATEGAAYGMGHEVSEAALGDPNQTASSVFQHVGLAALLGAGLGGAFGAGEAVVPKLVEKAGQGLKKLTDKVGEVYPEWVEKTTGVPSEYADAVVKARATTQDAAESVLNDAVPQVGVEPPMEGPRPEMPGRPQPPKRAPVVNPPEGWAREVGQSLQDTHEAFEDMAKEGAKIRPVEVEQLAAEINPMKARMKTQEAYEQLFTTGQQMEADELTFGTMGKKVTRIAENLKEALEGGTPIEQYQALMEARRQMSKLAKPGKFAEQLMDRDAIHAARGVTGSLRDALTDVEAWGENGVRTAAFNAAKSEFDGNARLFRKYFMTEGKLDMGKVERLLNNFDAPGMDKAREALEGWLRTGAKYKDVIGESASHAAMPLESAEAVTRLTDKSSEMIRQARASAAADAHYAAQQEAFQQATREFDAADRAAGKGFDQARSAQRAEYEAAQSARQGQIADYAKKLSSTPAGAGMSWFETGLLGHLASMLPGGRLLKYGLYGYKLTRGFKGMSVTGTVGWLSRLENINKAITGSIKRNADTLIRGGERVGQVSRREAAAGVGKLHEQSPDDQRAIFKQMMDRINQLSDPQTQLDHLHEATQSLYPHAPQTTGALQQKTSAAIQHLKATAPGRDKMALLDQPREPNQTEVARWLRRVEAIDDPVTVLKKAANGTLTKEHVEALEAVHPELLASMREATLNSLSGYKGTVPREARTGLGLLLGQPVTLSRNAQSLQATAGLYASRSQPGPNPPSATASKASKLTLANRTTEGTTSQPRSKV